MSAVVEGPEADSKPNWCGRKVGSKKCAPGQTVKGFVEKVSSLDSVPRVAGSREPVSPAPVPSRERQDGRQGGGDGRPPGAPLKGPEE